MVRDGVEGRVLPLEPQAWAQAILALARDDALRLRLLAQARATLSQ